jgi:hypothetical protein
VYYIDILIIFHNYLYIPFSYFYGCLFLYFLFFPCTDMNNSDYSTQDDTSDSDYGKEKNENDVLILAAAEVEFVKNYYMSYIAKELCRTSSQTGYK